ncbi:MAG: Extracellular ligand-binding receptor [Candidatus Taylorbacteria bacterium]|nr:Extracellular ligand-binding receptor [Candidatus Taylorbacteria bacterium]
MNTKSLRILCSILLLVIIVFAVYKGSKGNEASGDIKIGGILIMSGGGAAWGDGSKSGMQMAVEDINKNGGVNGRKLSLVLEDDAGDPKKAISAFSKLTNSDGAKFIIGPNWSNSGLALVDLAKNNKAVLISPTLGVKEFNEGSENIFNTWPHDFILSRNIADYVYKKGYRNVAIFGLQDSWVYDQTKNFKERFEELGGKVALVYEPQATETDMRAGITKVKADKSIDAIIMTVAGYSQSHIMPQQIRSLSVNLPIFSVNIDKKSIHDCGAACEDMIFLSYFTPNKQFEAKYKAKFGAEVLIGADSSYDAVMLLAKAMTETKSTDVASVSKYLNAVKEYDGMSGNLKSDGKRAFIKPYTVNRVMKGEPVAIVE